MIYQFHHKLNFLDYYKEKEFERVGGNTTIKADVRVICATKIDLWEKAKLNQFREDLYYRLRVIPVKLPPLCERKEDIPFIDRSFSKKRLAKQLYISPPKL